ncbi:MAG: CDP-glycerol glycerophosphotransferase family protein, partial [Treponema sp.]|nr:CDP-glycerol glycerophosphotransferase family protein [Treponema sp.]
VFNAGYKFIKSEYIGEGNRAFARLNLLSAGFVLMTTPGLDVYQLKRSRLVKHYSHVLHAASDAVMYRMFGIDYFDSILLTGDYQAKDIRALEKSRGLPEKKLVTVGCGYLDIYRERMKEIPVEENHPFTVLISPSWGPSALLSRFGSRLLDPLVKTGWRVIVRPHPQSKKSEPSVLAGLEEKYKANTNLEWDYERENIYSLKKADIMISDFSGIIFDYAFLCDKPVMYVKQGIDLRPYDADDLGDNAANGLWQFKTLEQIGIELKEEYFDRIGEVLKNISDNTELRQARQKAREEAWQYQGEAGKRIADFMLETIKTTQD